ncbi:MAG: hypothetical protein JWR19_1418 [Pedosphaera sp.]|nr:hypothetical protein [Pedosphaera sp.]
MFQRTVDSLVAQTERSFSVLISDNYSTKGDEFIGEATERLQRTGIAVRRVRPPVELGRVEHWNWAHYESGADWLKPLFAGDWLDAAYMAKLRGAMASNASCRYIFCPYLLHLGDQPPTTVSSPWVGRFQRPAEMQPRVLSHGMQFGPPSAAAMERTAWISVGGYPTALPICADSLMFCTLAATFGVLGLTEPLCHFNIHDARFSTNLAQRAKDSFREAITYFGMLGYRAWAERVSFSKLAYARLLWRETRAYLAKGKS